MRQPLYQVIAREFERYARCEDRPDIRNDASTKIVDLVREHMPSGSGIDSGTKLDFGASKPDRLVFTFGYHHMNDVGMYDGWTEHTLIVTPSLHWGMETRITGPDRNQIKEYLYDTYGLALTQLVEDGTMLVRGEDEAIAVIRDLINHCDSVDGDPVKAIAEAREFIKRKETAQ